ncbi:hypothetical protein GNF80_06205 [Clostridium perfringens]|nr:hypothetical protein [Clostridium perfringens]
MKEFGKIIVVYSILWIETFLVGSYFNVDVQVSKSNLVYLGVFALNTVLFLVLIRVLKVKLKTVFIFLGIISVAMVILLLNLNTYSEVRPVELITPFLAGISMIFAYSFQLIFIVLSKYDIREVAYFIVPLYMIFLFVLSYLLCRKFKEIKERDG